MPLLGELKKRNVFKVAAGYAVVAWLLMQVASIVFPAVGLPDWTVTFAVLILVLGFPVALLLAWAYELTPDGIKQTKSVLPSDGIAQQPSRRLVTYSALVLVVIGGGVVANRYVMRSVGEAEVTSTEAQDVGEIQASPGVTNEATRGLLTNSVAVLPFDNVSPDANDAYFATGIHEEILGALAGVRSLNVIARTSVLGYPTSGKSIRQIAEELNVELVMEGSVRRAGDQVRVFAQLINGATETEVWSEIYDGNLSDVFAIQADIAGRIVVALQAEILPAEQERIERIPTDSPEAYALFLRAVSIVGDPAPWTSPDLLKEYHDILDRAIAFDPMFADAHASKALAYATSLGGVRRNTEDTTPSQIAELAQTHADMALAIEPTNGRAYAAIARIHESSWQGSEAREAYQRAYQLSPQDSNVITDYAVLHFRAGRYVDAVALGRRLADLNPGQGNMILAHCLWWSGDYDASAAEFRRAIAANPAIAAFHRWLGVLEIVRGNYAVAADELGLSERLSLDTFVAPADLAELAYGYARLGNTGDARRVFERMSAMATDYAIGSASWSLAYLSIGDRESALNSMTTAAEQTLADEGFLTSFALMKNIYSDPILEHPEFTTARRGLGFED